MAGDGSSNSGIPTWQRNQAEQRAATSNAESAKDASVQQAAQGQAQSNAEQALAPTKQDDLVQHAQRFLQDERIRDSSETDKRTFLESKGLAKDDIDKAMVSTRTDTDRPREVAITSKEQERQPPTPPKELPPIITYPESMAQPTKPPPLITIPRLVNTAYAAAGLSALVYGTSKYLIQPMFESLTAARHDFAGHSKDHVDQLIQKLETMVSQDPKHNPAVGAPRIGTDPETDANDNESFDSDPTELFHRDFGTQTSPELESSSSESGLWSAPSDVNDRASDTDRHCDKLLRLQKLCEQVTGAEQSETDSYKEVSTIIKVLNEQLDGMSIPASTFSYYNSFERTGTGSRQKDDEISRMKNEIRGIKGALLSAKNFPGGRR